MQLPDAVLPDTPVVAPPDGSSTGSTDAGDPTLLSMQGVYGDFAQRTIPSDAFAFEPRWSLWIDGATKRRWLILPPGTATIDTSDPDHWILPIGARLVKELTRSGTLVETRILERTSAGDYSLRTYVWNAAQTEATLATAGVTDVNGTGHDAPPPTQCHSCHDGEPGRALGFSAVQLPASVIAALAAAGRLSTAVGAVGPTGDATAIAALGYLHANCGHCHNPNGLAAAANNQTLRLDAAAKPVEQEPGWVTTVGVAVQGNGLGAHVRIDPQQPTNSAVLARMSVRGAGQMPPIATHATDPDGLAAITAWIEALPTAAIR